MKESDILVGMNEMGYGDDEFSELDFLIEMGIV